MDVFASLYLDLGRKEVGSGWTVGSWQGWGASQTQEGDSLVGLNCTQPNKPSS